MNRTRHGFWAAAVLLAGTTGCTTYVEQQSPPVTYSPPPTREEYVPPSPPQPPPTMEVVIRDERDFYEPLSPYGHWELIGSYGRCWVPNRVEANWRPYSNGHWERTDAGWYWVSTEPWGWATYHYGRWDFNPNYGWFWVPQTQWAPAWVSWHRGGGYVGWAPLHPADRWASSGEMEIRHREVPDRAYVFVEERRFLEPVRPTTVVNNTTIINKTVNITNVKVVNNTVINEGPRTQIIEQASGRQVKALPVRELRKKSEVTAASEIRARTPERIDRQTPTAARQPVDRKAQDPAARQQLDEQRRSVEIEKKAQMEEDRRLKESQRRAQEQADRQKQDAARQAKEDARAKVAQETELRHQQALQKEQRIESERRAKEAQTQIEAARRARVVTPDTKAETDKQKQMDADRRIRGAQPPSTEEGSRQRVEPGRQNRDVAEKDLRLKRSQQEALRRQKEADSRITRETGVGDLSPERTNKIAPQPRNLRVIPEVPAPATNTPPAAP
jgi:hypothetical protein